MLVNSPERNAFVVKKYLQHASGRQAVAFCVDVAHAHALAAEFRAASVKTAVVTGEMPTAERQAALQALREKSVQVRLVCCESTRALRINDLMLHEIIHLNALLPQCPA